MKLAGHVARMGETKDVYRVLVGKPEGKRPLGRRGCRWEDNIKMGLQEVGCGCMDWIDKAQDRDRWMLYWTFGFHKMREIYWLAENLLASQEGLWQFAICAVHDDRSWNSLKKDQHIWLNMHKLFTMHIKTFCKCLVVKFLCIRL